MVTTIQRNSSFLAQQDDFEHGFGGGYCQWKVPVDGFVHDIVMKHGGITGKVYIKDNDQTIYSRVSAL